MLRAEARWISVMLPVGTWFTEGGGIRCLFVQYLFSVSHRYRWILNSLLNVRQWKMMFLNCNINLHSLKPLQMIKKHLLWGLNRRRSRTPSVLELLMITGAELVLFVLVQTWSDTLLIKRKHLLSTHKIQKVNGRWVCSRLPVFSVSCVLRTGDTSCLV